jgi:hypothetical protein
MTKTLILCHVLLCGAALAQNTAPANLQGNSPAASSASKTASTSSAIGRYRPERFAGRAGTYYRLVWGVDDLSVKSAEAGEMIRFTYTVLDPKKAKMLNDQKNEPSLVDEQAHVRLVVPQMDKVGKLRQSTDPEAGRSYWMLFSNKGGHVKRGDRVTVIVGKFRAAGLVVD